MGTQAKTSMDKELNAYTKRLHLVGTVTMLAVLGLTFRAAPDILSAYKSFPGRGAVGAGVWGLFCPWVWGGGGGGWLCFFG